MPLQTICLPPDSPVLTHNHELHLAEPVPSSTGPTTVYFDGIGACLCPQCIPQLRTFFETALQQLGNAWPVASGASGALILGLLQRGTYLSAKGKLNGPKWRNLEPARNQPIALIDDCAFSGATFTYLKDACEKEQLNVVGEIVLLDRRLP